MYKENFHASKKLTRHEAIFIDDCLSLVHLENFLAAAAAAVSEVVGLQQIVALIDTFGSYLCHHLLDPVHLTEQIVVVEPDWKTTIQFVSD